MILSDSIDPKGQLTLQFRNAKNELVEEIAAHNDIVQTGRDLVAKLFINQNIPTISHVAIGTGASVTVPGTHTQLDSELFRKAINPINPANDLVITPAGKAKITISCDLDFNEGNGPLTEAGLFNANNAGVMYNRVVFPPVNKTVDFKLTLIWEITF
ncbi:MAG: hypothetical protein H6581_14095 [Bacteroidia bacterium]|nr:hypothetical protein [Bacteroidia bacterium]